MNSQKKVLVEYIGAFWKYLKYPKTIFDIKDRVKALVFFALLVIFFQYLVEYFKN